MKKRINLVVFLLIATLFVTFCFERNMIAKACDNYSSVLETDLSQDDVGLMHEENWLNQYIAANCSKSISELTLDDFRSITSITKTNSNLTEIPVSIKFCSNITSLSVYGNKISTIPVEIKYLKKLNYLYLGNTNYKTGIVEGNPINELPKEIGELVNLKYLYLDGCNFRTLPDSISNLISLTSLHAPNNYFTDIPACVYKLSENKTSSVAIQLEFNQITNITPKNKSYPKLCLDIAGNYLTSKPDLDCKQLLYYGNFIKEEAAQYQLTFSNTDDIKLKVGEKINIKNILTSSFTSGMQVMGDGVFENMRIIPEDTSIINEYGNTLKNGVTTFRVKFVNNPDSNTNGITTDSIKIIVEGLSSQENLNIIFSQSNTIELLLSDNCIDFEEVNGLVETPSKEIEISVISSLNYSIKMAAINNLNNDNQNIIPISKIKYSFQNSDYFSLSEQEITLVSNELFTGPTPKKYKMSFKIESTIGYKAGRYDIPINIIVIQE